MDVATIKGWNANPGAPKGWTPENGPCGTLPIIYGPDQYGNMHSTSAWKPTPEELARGFLPERSATRFSGALYGTRGGR